MIYVNGKKVAVKELIEKYNIPVPKKTLGIFELDSSQVRIDRSNGGIKYAVEKRFKPVFRATDPTTQDEIEVLYTEATPKKKDDVLYPSPRKVTFEGHRQSFNMDNELERYVFYYLYPRNQESPFRRNKPAYWKVLNLEGLAKTQLKFDDSLSDALLFIKQSSVEDLKKKGKGMGMSFYEMSDSEVKSSMMTKAKNDPTKFIQQVTDSTVEWKGRVKDAIDENIFIVKTRNGMPCWYWNKGDQTGEEIGVIERNANHFESLLTMMTKDFQKFYTQLKELQRSADNTEKITAELNKVDSGLQTMVMALVGKNLIALAGNKVCFMKAGKPGDAIVTLKEGENWIEVATQAIEADTVLQKRLRGTYNLTK